MRRKRIWITTDDEEGRQDRAAVETGETPLRSATHNEIAGRGRGGQQREAAGEPWQ